MWFFSLLFTITAIVLISLNLPKDLVETINVDITNLALNANIRVEDVKAPGLEIMNSPRIPIASVVMTRQLKQEEATAAKEVKKK